MSTPAAPRPALTPEREKELLDLIERYWSIRTESKWIDNVNRQFPASWAESEACLREVAGECMVRMDGCGVDRYSGPDGRFYCLMEGHSKVYADDVSRSVALLKAFCAAFGSEPRHE